MVMMPNAEQIFVLIIGANKIITSHVCPSTLNEINKSTYRLFSSNMPIIWP
jgi:hypothetical protein